MIYTQKITTIIFISLLVLFVVVGINLGIQSNKIGKLEAAKLPVVPIQKLPSLADLEVTVLSVFDSNRGRYGYTLLIDWIALPPHVRPKQRYFNISIHDKYLYITSKDDTRKIKIADKGDFTLDSTMLEHEPYHNRLVVDVFDKKSRFRHQVSRRRRVSRVSPKDKDTRLCMQDKRSKPKKGFSIPFLTRRQEREKQKQSLQKKAREAVKVNKR